MTHFFTEYGLDIPIETFGLFGGIFLAFAIFRIPYLSYFKEAIIIAFVLSTSNFITYDILHMPIYLKETIALIVSFFLYMLFIKTKPWHTFLIALSGYILSQLTMLIFVLIFMFFGLVTIKQIMHSESLHFVFQLAGFVAGVGIGLFLYDRNIGFVFISEKMNFNPSLKKINALIISSTLIGFVVLQLAIYATIMGLCYNEEAAIGLLVILDVSLWAIYTRSKREHKLHYEQIDTKQFFN